MDDSHITSIAELADFVKAAKLLSLKGAKQKEVYEWVEKTLGRFRYFSLRKKEKTVVKNYLLSVTGLSDAQMTRMIARKKKFGIIALSTKARYRFPKKYGPEDIALLLTVDNAHERLSGKATRAIIERECDIFGKKQYERLKRISVSHLYTLRGTRQYRFASTTFEKTKATLVSIGERRKPLPNGIPGYLRVDSVHQGDKDKIKGVYHINITDEVTQFEFIGCVPAISEYWMEKLLEELLLAFPFVVINFHSDNGSEYINKIVAKLLERLRIKQTKSRSRHSNDNALAESKNGSIVRKHMGYVHIPKENAEAINKFYVTCFNEYLNYHRPCGFATTITDKKGKEKKVYDIYLTPCRRFLSLPGCEKYLKNGVSALGLLATEQKMSDTEYAAHMRKTKKILFTNFTKD